MEEVPADRRTDAGGTIAFDRSLDWVIAALLGVLGVLVGLGGGALYYATDRGEVATLLSRSEFQSEVLTEAQAVDALVALGHWSGIGLVAAGVVIAFVGIVVVVAHGRAREGRRKTPRWILGVVGAIVGTGLGFVPLSPIIGGGVAGYLERDRRASGIGTGTMAGLFTMLPALVVVAFASVGLVVGLPGEVAAVLLIVLVVLVFTLLTYLVGLSALGGYIGAWIRES